MTRYRILCYHGVYDDTLVLSGRNSSGKHVPRGAFDAQMAWLAHNVPLVTMRQIAAAHRGEGSIPEGAVAVTFDDGFRNNLTEAMPVLRRHGVPATVYLATGFVGTGRAIWSDRLEAAFLESPRSELALEIQEREHAWSWDDTNGRLTAYEQVKAHCKQLPDAVRRAAVEAVCEQLGDHATTDHPLYGFLDWDDVGLLLESGLVDIGAHTVDHVSLARTEQREMERQIDDSLDRVAQVTGCRDLFAYPEGQPGDVDERVISHLQVRGLDHAPMAVAGENDATRSDPFRLARDMVGFAGIPFPFPKEGT